MSAFQIFDSQVVYEILSSEVIVVDFRTGDYYALLHVAKQVWQLIEKRLSFDRIAKILSEHYKKEIDTISADLQLFFDQLVECGLIEAAVAAAGEAILSSSDNWEYTPPKLQKYTDIENLLLIDPIHEVSEVGWPSQQG